MPIKYCLSLCDQGKVVRYGTLFPNTPHLYSMKTDGCIEFLPENSTNACPEVSLTLTGNSSRNERANTPKKGGLCDGTKKVQRQGKPRTEVIMKNNRSERFVVCSRGKAMSKMLLVTYFRQLTRYIQRKVIMVLTAMPPEANLQRHL